MFCEFWDSVAREPISGGQATQQQAANTASLTTIVLIYHTT